MTYEQITWAFFNAFGQLVLFGSGSAALAFGIFRFLGQRWIEHKFSEQLEKSKHEQAKELENFKFKINSLFNRVTKMQEKEFEVLPIAWSKLKDAHGPLMVCVLGFQEYPGLQRMSEEELEEFLSSVDLLDTQKQQLRISENKDMLFSGFLTTIQLHKARAAYSDFSSYIEKNSIFLRKDIKEKFSKVSEIMWELWAAKSVGEHSGTIDMALNSYEKHNDELKRLIKEIEDLLHPRLFPQDYPDQETD